MNYEQKLASGEPLASLLANAAPLAGRLSSSPATALIRSVLPEVSA